MKDPQCKGRTINALGGGSGKSGGKKTQRLLAREKETQLNNPEEKKTHQPVGQGKKLISQLARKKKLNMNSLPEAPPDHQWS